MGISLGGIGRFLGNAITPATNVLAARQQAQATAKQQEIARMIQQMQMQREQEKQDLLRQSTQSTIGKNTAQTDLYKKQASAQDKPITLSQGAQLVDPKTLQPVGPKPTGKPTNPIVGSPEWKEAEKYKASLRPKPQSTNVYLPGVDPETGKTTIYAGASKGTPSLTNMNVGKPESAGVGSAINQAAKARLEAAVSEMNNAHNNMEEYEKKLATGKARIGVSAQVLQRMANAFTHDDPLSQLTQSGTLALLNRSDPELARYIRRGLSFAEGESMISQRPSDFRTKMAAFLSTAASGASPEMIGDIQGRRSSILNPLNKTIGHQGTAPATSPAGATTREQQLWDAAVKLHGREKVIQEYGPRPEDEE